MVLAAGPEVFTPTPTPLNNGRHTTVLLYEIMILNASWITMHNQLTATIQVSCVLSRPSDLANDLTEKTLLLSCLQTP